MLDYILPSHHKKGAPLFIAMGCTFPPEAGTSRNTIDTDDDRWI